MALVKYVLPLFSIVFLVIGLMLLGVASPTEAAALGALGCFLVAALYRKLSWEVARKAVSAALSITVMIFMIIAGSTAFSQVLAFSGATVSLPVAPIIILIMMQILLLILGCFIEQVSIMMITIPIFMPIVRSLGWDPVWFGAIFLLNMEIAAITPPFGVSLFVMKAVGPAGTTMADIYRAAFPFVLLNLLVMALMMIYPPFSLWLPGMMRG
jgi:tripartite ATP-independent transporter DctM subunit